MAWHILKTTAQKKLGRVGSTGDLAEYLNGRMDGDFGRTSGGFSTVWQRVRPSTTVSIRPRTDHEGDCEKERRNVTTNISMNNRVCNAPFLSLTLTTSPDL